MEIKKAVVPVAGLGTRFLPLSKIFPKELWPLVDKPVLQYTIEEIKNSGIKEVVFINNPNKKLVNNYLKKYFSPDKKLRKILSWRNKTELLEELTNLEKITAGMKFSYVEQKEPLGDGDALLKAEKKLGKEPFAVLFGDDVIVSKMPCLAQLMEVFSFFKKPLLSLCKVATRKLSSYGVVAVKNTIKDKVYIIEDIVEKPSIDKAPSNLAVVGRYILTPDVFSYLKKLKGSIKKEVILANALKNMISNRVEVVGVEFEGKWLECGNKLAYLQSNIYLSLNHPVFGKEIRNYLNQPENYK